MNQLKIESKLFDRLVRFAGRNLEPKEPELDLYDLNVGKVLKTKQGDLMVIGWKHTKDSDGTQLELNLRETKIRKGN